MQRYEHDRLSRLVGVDIARSATNHLVTIRRDELFPDLMAFVVEGLGKTFWSLLFSVCLACVTAVLIHGYL